MKSDLTGNGTVHLQGEKKMRRKENISNCTAFAVGSSSLLIDAPLSRLRHLNFHRSLSVLVLPLPPRDLTLPDKN